jgi:hypothetical protein
LDLIEINVYRGNGSESKQTISTDLQPGTLAKMTDTAPVSIASFAPINFAFDDLKAKMNRFTSHFDKWTHLQRQRVLQERNEFAKSIADSRGIVLTLLHQD